jgi:hypothetical protein
MAGILYVSITLLTHYQIPEFCLLGIIIYHAFRSYRKTMIKAVMAFLLSVTIVIYIPIGVIQMLHPEAKRAEPEIVKSLR